MESLKAGCLLLPSSIAPTTRMHLNPSLEGAADASGPCMPDGPISTFWSLSFVFNHKMI